MAKAFMARVMTMMTTPAAAAVARKEAPGRETQVSIGSGGLHGGGRRLPLGGAGRVGGLADHAWRGADGLARGNDHDRQDQKGEGEAGRENAVADARGNNNTN